MCFMASCMEYILRVNSISRPCGQAQATTDICRVCRTSRSGQSITHENRTRVITHVNKKWKRSPEHCIFALATSGHFLAQKRSLSSQSWNETYLATSVVFDPRMFVYLTFPSARSGSWSGRHVITAGHGLFRNHHINDGNR
jgi:hypothetical protein